MSSVTSIGDYAFSDCSSLSSVGDLSSVTSIGRSAFYGTDVISITINNIVPPELDSSGVFYGAPAIFFVPDEALQIYKENEQWKEMSSRILPIGTQANWDVMLTPNGKASALQNAIGEENLQGVVSLKITGDINGYDFFVMRNKMPNLHILDMTDANIKASDDNFCYYSANYTQDSILGSNAFYQHTMLMDVKLPKSIKSIEWSVFEGCSNLRSVTMYDGVKYIGGKAFQDCNKLKYIKLPSSLISIGYYSFHYCWSLDSIIIPDNVIGINESAFDYCSSLKKVTFPAGLKQIGNNAFRACPLQEIELPAGIEKIGEYAFDGCSNLNTVKVTALDPNSVQISDNTFITYSTATLYIPYDEDTGWDATYNAYYWNTQWGQFLNMAKWKPNYEYVSLNDDYDQAHGTIPGDSIDADFGSETGYQLGDDAEQTFDDVNLSDGGSVIVDGNININNLNVNITINANRWHFFCFPFNIDLNLLNYAGNYVWYEYDGAARATNGSGGWKRLADNATLEAGKGYIFQSNKGGTLTIPTQRPDLQRRDKDRDLNAHSANNSQDASWNFIGNPFLSYFDMNNIDFDSPITVWNGSTYDAIRPGDDDYHFRPYEAFFVQKPQNKDNIGFGGAGQESYHQSQKKAAEAKARDVENRAARERKLVNLTITNGTNTDKTRIVFRDVLKNK